MGNTLTNRNHLWNPAQKVDAFLNDLSQSLFSSINKFIFLPTTRTFESKGVVTFMKTNVYPCSRFNLSLPIHALSFAFVFNLFLPSVFFLVSCYPFPENK